MPGRAPRHLSPSSLTSRSPLSTTEELDESSVEYIAKYFAHLLNNPVTKKNLPTDMASRPRGGRSGTGRDGKETDLENDLLSRSIESLRKAQGYNDQSKRIGQEIISLEEEIKANGRTSDTSPIFTPSALHSKFSAHRIFQLMLPERNVLPDALGVQIPA